MTMTDGVSSGTFWLTLAVINAGLAQSKNRSRLGWFLLSLLLGPVATLLIVVLRHGRSGTEDESTNGGYTGFDRR